MLLQLFNKPGLSLLIKGDKQFFPNTKAVRLPITREIPLKITRHQLTDSDQPSIDVVFKIAWESFMRISRIIFTAAQQAALLFKDTKVTRVDISLSEFDQFVTLKLKTRKTSVNHTRVLIEIEAKHQQNCLVMSLRKLFFQESPAGWYAKYQPVKKAFSCKYLINRLRSCLAKCRIDVRNYSGHCFWQKVAQYASDCGMLNQSIQKLRR